MHPKTHHATRRSLNVVHSRRKLGTDGLEELDMAHRQGAAALGVVGTDVAPRAVEVEVLRDAAGMESEHVIPS